MEFARTPCPDRDFTIVALGASAGGLEALQAFFKGMPSHDQFAFVVVTHLPPQHPSHMAEILRRATPMPVIEARNEMPVEAAHVYVIPPNRVMGIRMGALRLEEEVPRPPVPHPIDYFMSALAEDFQEQCAGIVLSGADHDGTAGLKEIKAAGGLTIVQAPESAQFPGMPASAIAAGVPDFVLPPEEMGRALVEFVGDALGERTPEPSRPDQPGAPSTPLPDRLDDILEIVRARSGQDFRWYRPAMLGRRLRRRMGVRSIRDASAYIELLKESDQEVQALVKDFRISVTEFFRQRDAWNVLENEVLPNLIKERTAARASIRVWTPGCATGEESYSIAMLLLEQLRERSGDPPVAVFGSDVDPAALAVARAGSYPESVADLLGPQRLTRYFEKQGDRYVARKTLREVVLFAAQDLVRDPPFSKLDLIICRNVLIYFEPALQSRILEMFHFALNPGGLLFLGKSESLGAQSTLFEPVSAPSRIFRRVGSARHVPRPFLGQWSGPRGYLTPVGGLSPGFDTNPAELVRRRLGDRAFSAAVLVNRDFRTLYFHGEASRFLQLSGEPAWDLLSLLRDGMRGRVRSLLQEAIAANGAVDATTHIVRDGQPVPIRVRVEPVGDSGRDDLLLVCFDEPVPAAGTPQIAPLASLTAEEERDQLRVALATAEREGWNTAAELRVAHEEAMSLNEELQSSNEELQTSKEELQSMNEELATLNSELEDKVNELERVLGDLRNLMDSTRVATLFLDREMRIRRFTREATRLFRVIASDEGRSLRDITPCVEDPTLFEDAAAVLDNIAPREAEVAIAGKEWFLRRILPNQGPDDRIEGVVVTYTDISALRLAAQDVRRLAAVLRDSNDAVIVHDFDGKILFWNAGAERTYGYSEQRALGMNLGALEPAASAGSALALAQAARQVRSAGPVMSRRIGSNGRTLEVSVTASVLRDDSGTPYAVVTTERDLTDHLRQESELRFRVMADDIPTLLRIDDAAGQAQYLNRAWLLFTGETAAEALLADGWFRYVHPDDLAAYLKGMREAGRTGRRFEGDLRLRRADGCYRWVRSTAVARADQPGYVCVCVDIEERKLAERAVAEENERKDEFLAMLAHELRNPLAPITNAVAVIERCAKGDDKIAWAAGAIGRQVQQLVRLVDDLMDVARITSGKIALARELIDIPALVERARDLSLPLIESRNQRLAIRLPEKKLCVEGDLVRLTQVLANLLNNASKYSDAGAEIDLEVRADESDVEILVTDPGAGISAEMLPRVFDLFAQDDKTLDRAQGGLGIGLTLVDRLVRAHGGSVHAQSNGRGHGSQFTVRLPTIRPPPGHSPETANAESAGRAGGRRILVVDDSPDNLASMALLLQMAGHEVRTASNGQEAVALALEFKPEVAMLDIGLPGMSGYDLARALRARSETCKTHLIAVTGYGRSEDVARAEAAGFDHHLVKPVQFDKLMAIVQQRS